MNGTITVVPLTPAHVDQVMAHEQEMFGPESWTRAGYLAEIADIRSRYYVAAEDSAGTLLGWAGLLITAPQGEILTIGSVPAHRRRGIGTALIAHLVDHARTTGVTELFLEVREDNDAARTLYEREGFAQVGLRRGYYESGRIAAVVMRREL